MAPVMLPRSSFVGGIVPPIESDVDASTSMLDRIRKSIGQAEHTLYFGDLHGHSYLSGDVHNVNDSPELFYSYARDRAGLDFAALTDHDGRNGLEDVEKWDLAREVTASYLDEGAFVTFVAFEWSSHIFGHRCVYFPGEESPDEIFDHRLIDYDLPEKLWDHMAPYGAIAIPHHVLGAAKSLNWDHYNPDVEPLVEVYSYHGNSEAEQCLQRIWRPMLNGYHSVQYALGRGYRFGLIGSTDTHRARGGNFTHKEHWLDFARSLYNGCPAKGGGLIAAYAQDLSRASLWDAFVNRRVYATTGEKIVVDFSINGHFMGESLSTAAPPMINVDVLGTGHLATVEIVRNGDAVPLPVQPASNGLTAQVVDEEIAPGTSCYYLRVVQADGEMAWSSPIWVDY